MKLLLNQNLSHRLVPDLAGAFPGSQHVRHFDLTEADDGTIWKYAREHDFVILSKDADFFNRSLLQGHPPKVIQLRLGNCSTERILDILLAEKSVISRFLEKSKESVLIIE